MDKIDVKVTKSLPNSVIGQLCFLFNAPLNLRHFPSPWKRALLRMVLKKGNDPCWSTFSKIFEQIVLNRLLDIDTFNDALPNHQFGFRSRNPAIEQVHRVVNHILDALESHKYCSAVFLDVRQTFDRVWREGLFYKLMSLLPEWL